MGVIGCGEISARYLRGLTALPRLSLAGCASRSPERARQVAEAAGTLAFDEAALLAADVDLIVNLTEPTRHAEVTRRALLAGKHVYSEKPLASRLGEAEALIELARARGLTLGCAPATFLGPAQQSMRAWLDRGELGQIAGASVSIVYSGPDRWHPNPAPLFGPAAGPLFDMGVYGVAGLVALLGPVSEVSAFARRLRQVRVGADGENFLVTSPTHVVGLLKFAGGPLATLTSSFDATGSRSAGLEIQGERASLAVRHASVFDSPLEACQKPLAWSAVPHELEGWSEDHWCIGLFDLAEAILADRAPRTGADLAVHVLEVLTAVEESARSGQAKRIFSTCRRPPPLDRSAYRSGFRMDPAA